MTKIYLCYELDPKTGETKVVDVTDNRTEASLFIGEVHTASRVEEWNIGGGRYDGLKNTYYSVEEMS